MANPLTFLLPVRYHAVHSVALVESGPLELALQVARRVRELFPGCEIEGIVREVDLEAASGGFDRVTPVRWEDRTLILRRLRRRRYDAVVALLSSRHSHYLRLLPYLLRTRAILVFNDHLDYFPLHVTRLRALAHHLSGGHEVRAALPWLLGRLILVPLATLVLLASTARLYARAAWKRARA
jgi:hypothetical protein